MLENLFFNHWLLGEYKLPFRTLINKRYEARSVKELYEKMEMDYKVIERTCIQVIDGTYSCYQRIEILTPDYP